MTAAGVVAGAICLSNSSHFPLKLYSNCMKPVALPPGCARLDQTAADGVDDGHENYWNCAIRLQERPYGRAAGCEDDIWRCRDQFGNLLTKNCYCGPCQAGVEPQVAAFDPAQSTHRLHKWG